MGLRAVEFLNVGQAASLLESAEVVEEKNEGGLQVTAVQDKTGAKLLLVQGSTDTFLKIKQ